MLKEARTIQTALQYYLDNGAKIPSKEDVETLLGACPRIPQSRGNRANGTGT
jgi:hypothetical protein